MLPKAPTIVDSQAFAELKQQAARKDPKALAEAAVQFEALFIGMMLKSARDAGLGQGILDGGDTQQYLELMDKQVALELARGGGFGFGKLITNQLSPEAAASTQQSGPNLGPLPPRPPTVSSLPASSAVPPTGSSVSAASSAAGSDPAGGSQADDASSGPQAFVRRFLPDAIAAAKRLGVEPRVLLAQAALETGWGEAIPTHADGRPTNNLFGIKAGRSWQGDSAVHWTVENVDGVAQRKVAAFRAYPSSTASFSDYADLISGSPRYARALEQADDPSGYVRALADAGYATDPSYADKLLAVYQDPRLDGALAQLKHPSVESTQ